MMNWEFHSGFFSPHQEDAAVDLSLTGHVHDRDSPNQRPPSPGRIPIVIEGSTPYLTAGATSTYIESALQQTSQIVDCAQREAEYGTFFNDILDNNEMSGSHEPGEASAANYQQAMDSADLYSPCEAGASSSR